MKLTLGAAPPIKLDRADYIGIIYLSLPVVLFFSLFTLYIVAIPATCFLLYCLSRLRPVSSEKSELKLLSVHAISAATIVLLSGSTGPLYVNGDWVKHYAIFNEIANHSVLAEPNYTLRYYIGFYILPAQIERALGASNGIILSLWIWLGLITFFSQTSKLIKSPTLKYISPLIFMAFSGADVIGTYLTGFMRGNMYHFEWWAGWIEYSSPFTSIIWAPQSTLPAWIAMAYLMKRPHPEQQIFVAPILLLASLLWSPFATIGIVPFMLTALANPNFKRVAINAPYLAGIMILSILVFYYLTFDVGTIPRNWIWNSPCLAAVRGAPCATLSGYLRFVLLEVSVMAAISLMHKPTRNHMTYTAIAVLLLLPLTQVGANNDLAMNASRPAICALVISLILSLEAITMLRGCIIALGLACGITTPGGEIYRGLTFKRLLSTDTDLTYFIENSPTHKDQYITTKNIWFLRRSSAL